MKTKKPIPYDFVLEQLDPAAPFTRPMFGCTAVYVEDKIVLVLRRKDTYTQDNGIWLATTRAHHASLRKEFPNMRSISVLGSGVTGWQILPEDALDFEESVVRACQMILAGDARIGKVPEAKRRSTKKPRRMARS
jgi:hypothetical protein